MFHWLRSYLSMQDEINIEMQVSLYRLLTLAIREVLGRISILFSFYMTQPHRKLKIYGETRTGCCCNPMPGV
jgi:hypothetical protein